MTIRFQQGRTNHGTDDMRMLTSDEWATLDEPVDSEGAARLLGATLHQALEDARQGDAEALAWLATDGLDQVRLFVSGPEAERLLLAELAELQPYRRAA